MKLTRDDLYFAAFILGAGAGAILVSCVIAKGLLAIIGQ